MNQASSALATQKNHTDTLEEAFESFSEATNYLTEFYRGLESQVACLNAELASAKVENAKQSEESIRLANRLENLLKVLPAGVIVLDADGVITQANTAANALLGSPLEQQLWRDVVAREFAPRWDNGHDITLKDGRYVNLSTQSLLYEPGQIILIKDVTENRLLQDQFTDMKRLSAMGEMAASLAHQVRTPLSSAILYASNLCRQGLDEAVRQRFSEKLLLRLQNLESLVDDMLLFSRGGRFEAEEQSIHSFVDELDATLESKREEHACQIQLSAQLDQYKVNINSSALISCLHNLIDNAAQSTDEEVNIRLVFSAGDKYINIDVIDNGPGIPEKIRGQLFEPFFSTRSQGTGLGLAVVDAVVRAHNGKLHFDSELNIGTTFHIQIPIFESKE